MPQRKYGLIPCGKRTTAPADEPLLRWESVQTVREALEALPAEQRQVVRMRIYEEKTFDEWLEKDTKEEILKDLYERWQRETNGNAVFVSAIEKRNLEGLRASILEKVRLMYRVRYPYKSEFLY